MVIETTKIDDLKNSLLNSNYKITNIYLNEEVIIEFDQEISEEQIRKIVSNSEYFKNNKDIEIFKWIRYDSDNKLINQWFIKFGKLNYSTKTNNDEELSELTMLTEESIETFLKELTRILSLNTNNNVDLKSLEVAEISTAHNIEKTDEELSDLIKTLNTFEVDTVYSYIGDSDKEGVRICFKNTVDEEDINIIAKIVYSNDVFLQPTLKKYIRFNEESLHCNWELEYSNPQNITNQHIDEDKNQLIKELKVAATKTLIKGLEENYMIIDDCVCRLVNEVKGKGFASKEEEERFIEEICSGLDDDSAFLTYIKQDNTYLN